MNHSLYSGAPTNPYCKSLHANLLKVGHRLKSEAENAFILALA